MNSYTDYISGLGCRLLGYSFDVVNNAIEEKLKKGISLSYPLELQLTQKLVDKIHCDEMVRFGKNGSDVLAPAVTLARFITLRDHDLLIDNFKKE